jgi:ParB/RepB/Spo0J family partition protein
MSVNFELGSVRHIPLTALTLSKTGSQTERRAHFDKAAIKELGESIKTVGLLSPIIARVSARIDVVESDGGGRWYPAHKRKAMEGHNLIGGGHKSREAAESEAAALREKQGYEIVAGERRFMAAKVAGLEAIAVYVRELSDEQVLEIQLVENLQREGLHELAEAEGYEKLQGYGHSAEEIADKVGKSKGYVYSRLKLCALTQPARKAFYDGKLSASTALLVARLAPENQPKALKQIAEPRWHDQPMSFREAAELVRRDYMTDLSQAGFKTEDATLVPAAGACGPCPKRTGNQAELFGDVKNGNVCTDPSCFKAKREASAKRVIAQAEENGQTVVAGAAAKKILPHGADRPADGFKGLSDRCWDDSKNRTYGQLLGKDFEPVLVQDPQTGVVVKLAPPAAVKSMLKEKKLGASSASGSATQNAAEKKRKLEKAFRTKVYAEMRDKLPAELGREDLRVIAVRFYHEITNDHQKLIMGLWQLEPAKNKGYGLDCIKPVEALIASMNEVQISRFLFDLVFIKDLQVYNWSDAKPTLLLNTARKLKINPDKIRAELTAAAKPAKKAKAKNK